jgi:predicted  nucleic acid-binding Zn-ribbon protein
MPTATQLKQQLLETRGELAVAQQALPRIQALAKQHADTAAAARRGGANLEQLADLQNRADSFASVLSQHQADLRDAEARVKDLEAQLVDAERQEAHEKITAQMNQVVDQFNLAGAVLGQQIWTELEALNELEQQALKLDEQRQTYELKHRNFYGGLKLDLTAAVSQGLGLRQNITGSAPGDIYGGCLARAARAVKAGRDAPS